MMIFGYITLYCYVPVSHGVWTREFAMHVPRQRRRRHLNTTQYMRTDIYIYIQGVEKTIVNRPSSISGRSSRPQQRQIRRRLVTTTLTIAGYCVSRSRVYVLRVYNLLDGHYDFGAWRPRDGWYIKKKPKW